MTNIRLKSWNEIEALSQQLYELAHEEQWEELPKLESIRRQKLEIFFSEPVPVEMASEIAEGIRNIQKLDAEVILLAQQSQLRISAHLNEITKGKQVIEAYSNNS
ncbi:MAG: flagellar protein FliT [Gammaproteobacteria bacterium]|nr:flagellar protein FliT [Gammaproteobacteria bacterium]